MIYKVLDFIISILHIYVFVILGCLKRLRNLRVFLVFILFMVIGCLYNKIVNFVLGVTNAFWVGYWHNLICVVLTIFIDIRYSICLWVQLYSVSILIYIDGHRHILLGYIISLIIILFSIKVKIIFEMLTLLFFKVVWTMWTQ
jgi:hypothetical protein